MIQTESQTQAEIPPDKKESRVKSLIKQVVMIAAAAGLLYFSFRGCDLATIWAYSVKSNPIYLILLMVCGVISHVLRAIRWILLLKPLSDHKISLFNSFVAVIMGYAVNIAVPRGGEVVRLVSITRSEKLPWAGVLSTMFIDRLLDIALLVLLLGITLMVVPQSMFGDLPNWLVPGGIGLTVSTFVGLAVLPHMSKIMRWFLNLDLI
ncbi:MAG: flippase-like domain-containing protein, partial [Candidatus Melainabacteria bacterium]|nr:flippase-like domain-containing protein [Candidatus Melainabacteria bacterium]